eukprot:3693911-Prorocentrum_lima.AAC.1
MTWRPHSALSHARTVRLSTTAHLQRGDVFVSRAPHGATGTCTPHPRTPARPHGPAPCGTEER